jgi:hypothetical protein
MGQNVHVDGKTSNGAALAAPAIVNCPLSIVNFLGFAITSCMKLLIARGTYGFHNSGIPVAAFAKFAYCILYIYNSYFDAKNYLR